MKRSRFTEQPIVAVLKEAEAGVKTADVCRKHGVSSATVYAWKAKFGGLEVSDIAKVHGLEDENRWVRPLLADSATGALAAAVATCDLADGQGTFL